MRARYLALDSPRMSTVVDNNCCNGYDADGRCYMAEQSGLLSKYDCYDAGDNEYLYSYTNRILRNSCCSGTWNPIY